MKALVTGATGFIGSSLVREVLKDGVEVRVLVRKNSDTRNIDGLDVERVYGDIRNGDSVKAARKRFIKRLVNSLVNFSGVEGGI